MKIRELVDYWEKHARGRLSRTVHSVQLSDAAEARLSDLARRYPVRSRESLLRNLLSAAMDELESGFPYVEGNKVVAVDEDGYEIYEDVGITPRFLALTKQHMQELKQKKADQTPA
ncbi:MAG: pilin assembly protein [Halomonadaceae bacterium]|nr:MAG: pilin assembly protein [Halomonadaceae bacterium]